MSHTIHASTVAWDQRALVIMGSSGSGKSALALDLMAFGCALVADDRTSLTVASGALIARAPDTISGLIEARGVGILNATPAGPAQVSYVVDLDQRTDDRMPQRQYITLLGCRVPLILRVHEPHFPSALLQLLKAGRSSR